jgi:hypothetical protein
LQAASAIAPPSRIASFLIEVSPLVESLRTRNWPARARFQRLNGLLRRPAPRNDEAR